MEPAPLTKNSQNWAQNEVFGHFLEIESFVFANFAYDDRQAWCLTGDGGLSEAGPIESLPLVG